MALITPSSGRFAVVEINVKQDLDANAQSNKISFVTVPVCENVLLLWSILARIRLNAVYDCWNKLYEANFQNCKAVDASKGAKNLLYLQFENIIIFNYFEKSVLFLMLCCISFFTIGFYTLTLTHHQYSDKQESELMQYLSRLSSIRSTNTDCVCVCIVFLFFQTIESTIY